MSSQPRQIAPDRPGADVQPVLRLVEPQRDQVAFDASSLVQHEGIDGAQVGRADTSVVGRPDRAHDVLRVHQRPALPRFLHRYRRGAHAEQVRQRHLASDMDEPVLRGDHRRRVRGRHQGEQCREAAVAYTAAMVSRSPEPYRAGGARVLIDYDEFQRDVRRRKRERWAKILASESPGRAPGRRPRDPEQERMLLRLDRAALDERGPRSIC